MKSRPAGCTQCLAAAGRGGPGIVTSSLPGGKRCKTKNRKRMPKLHLIPMTQEPAQSNPIMMELYYSCSGHNQYKMRRPVWPSHAGGDSRPGGHDNFDSS